MSQNNKVSLKQTMATDDAIRYLEELVQAYKDGKIVVQQGDKAVSIEPGEDVAIEVEAKQKEGKSKFSLELSWRAPQPGEGDEVQISSEEPEQVPAHSPGAVVATAGPEETVDEEQEKPVEM